MPDEKESAYKTKAGEVMTACDVAERLLKEEIVRSTKKKKNSLNIKTTKQCNSAPQGSTTKQCNSAPQGSTTKQCNSTPQGSTTKQCNSAPQGSRILKSDLNAAQNDSTSNCKFDVHKIMTGNWVSVKYSGENSVKNFIGQITDMDGDDFIVKYVRKSLIGEFYIFPDNDDTDIVQKDQIINILKEPQLNKRGHYSFAI